MIQRAVEIYRNRGGGALVKKSASHCRRMAAHYHRLLDDKSIILTNQHFDLKYGKGESIIELDWDNLLLYDACRYDEFNRVAPISEDIVERRV